MKRSSFKIAVVQAAPVFMNRDASIEKACTLIAKAGKEGARLVVFPEAFISGYPDWIWHIPPGDMRLNQALYAKLLEASVSVPSPATERLGQAAKEAGIYLSIGINERSPSGGSLYNSLLYIGPDGGILGCHQKLVPTVAERMVWAYGDPATLEVYETEIGRLGGLIC
ncbi:MAG: hypothetical protein MUP09_08350, partial [Thiovulaceae bacterium]|nr:hypothetical protein [Sulfurimonadaceae bacterium]